MEDEYGVRGQWLENVHSVQDGVHTSGGWTQPNARGEQSLDKPRWGRNVHRVLAMSPRDSRTG